MQYASTCYYYKEILMIETSLPSEMMYRNPNPIWAYRKKALRGFFLGLVTHKSLGIRDTPTSRERGSKEKGRPLSLWSPNNDKHETSICSNVTNVVVYFGRKKKFATHDLFLREFDETLSPSRVSISNLAHNEKWISFQATEMYVRKLERRIKNLSPQLATTVFACHHFRLGRWEMPLGRSTSNKKKRMEKIQRNLLSREHSHRSDTYLTWVERERC